METGHGSEDSGSEGAETKDHCIAVAFPMPRDKMLFDLLLATAYCSQCDCVPIIRVFGVEQLPTCATVRPQVFLEIAGG